MSQAVTKPARRAATYEDLLAVPDPLVAELLFGELVTHPRPAPRHARAAGRLYGVLAPPLDLGVGGPGGWVFLMEPELHLGEHVAVPDIAAWRLERLPQLPETTWIEIAPDWVYEVLSPSTERYDRSDKQLIYAESGVAHLWQVNPVLRILEVFEIKDGRWLLLDVLRDDAQVAAVPFSDVRFSLSALWSSGPVPSARVQPRAAVVRKKKKGKRK